MRFCTIFSSYLLSFFNYLFDKFLAYIGVDLLRLYSYRSAVICMVIFNILVTSDHFLFALGGDFNIATQEAKVLNDNIPETVEREKDNLNLFNGAPFYFDQSNISTAAEQLAVGETPTDQYGRDIRNIHQQRSIYIVDDTDPFIAKSEKVNMDPKKQLTESVEEILDNDKNFIATCEQCPEEEYIVVGRREKKRYVYLDKPPYITAGQTCPNHGHLTIKVELLNESDGLFLENGDFNNIQLISRNNWGGAYVDEVYSVNGTRVTLRKTIMQNGHPWIHPHCYLVPSLQNHVLSAEVMIKKLLGGDKDETLYWGEIGGAQLHHRIVNDTHQHYWHMDDKVSVCEDLVKKGLCAYKEKKKDPPSEKFWKGKRIVDSWGETVTYSCKANCPNTCSDYISKGCSRQPNPKCIKKIQNTCVRWEWKFLCQNKKGIKIHKFGGKNPFCLGGECIDSSYNADEDMGKALSYLAILDEVKKDMGDTSYAQGINIFKGNDMRCARHMINFSDCCGSGGGWGTSLGLTKCNSEEKTLAKFRSEGRCVYIGTYCVERESITKTCIREKSSYCCYGSKFAKLLQEQGKRQLNIGHGGAENPNCRGFSAEELSRIDFSQLDLSEIVQDVVNNFKPITEEHFANGNELKNIQEHYKDRLGNTNGSQKEAAYIQENIKHMFGK